MLAIRCGHRATRTKQARLYQSSYFELRQHMQHELSPMSKHIMMEKISRFICMILSQQHQAVSRNSYALLANMEYKKQ